MIFPHTEKALHYLLEHRSHLLDVIFGEYEKEIEKEYEMIKRYLPKEADTIVDIGCGFAGIDVLLSRHYPKAKFLLVDGTGDVTSSDERAGWHGKYNPYNDRAIVDEFLRSNEVTNYKWVDVDTPEELKADLVVSFLAWGYHFPLNSYRVRTPCAISTLRIGYEPSGLVRDRIHIGDNWELSRFKL